MCVILDVNATCTLKIVQNTEDVILRWGTLDQARLSIDLAKTLTILYLIIVSSKSRSEMGNYGLVL